MSEAVRAGAVRPASRVQSVLWFVVNHPVRLLLVTVLLALVTGAGLQHASINNSDRALFARDNPGLQQLEAVESRFTKDDSVVIIVRPHDGDVFTRRNLTLLSELTEQAWTIPHTQRVDSLTNFQHTEVDGDDLNVTDLVSDPDQLSDAELVRIRDIALREPNLVRNVVSERGHAATINVSVVTESDGGREAPAIMEVVEALRADFSARYPDVDILLTGMVAFKAASQATTEHEIKTTSLFSMAAILLCLLVMLQCQRRGGDAAGDHPVQFDRHGHHGVWFGVEITPVMAGAPAIILTLAVADSIHLLISYQQFLREGLGKQVAMYESLRVNASPVFLTSITTAIGFLCLNASQSPPFVDMANLVTIGVMAAWLLSMVFLPALMMLLPTPKLAQHSERHAWMDHLGILSLIIASRCWWCQCWCSAGLAALSVKNQFNDVWIDYFDETYEVRRATDFMVQEITGHHRSQFAFPPVLPTALWTRSTCRGWIALPNSAPAAGCKICVEFFRHHQAAQSRYAWWRSGVLQNTG
ncbi:MAG: MMPL family transporter [Gammaproteobacteria bacterium]